tara:strand:- start:30584 stop:30898 length:315 start_codon:yes stop_codon:yes gene_type:complete
MKENEYENKKKFFKDLLLEKIFIFEDKDTLDLYILKKSKNQKNSHLINVTENNKNIHFYIEEIRFLDFIYPSNTLVKLDTNKGNILGYFYDIKKDVLRDFLDKN